MSFYIKIKGRESNCQFDSRPLKVRNHHDFLVWRWCVTYRWKALNEGYNFVVDLTSIEGLHTKLWVSKVAGVPIFGIPGQNDIWVLALWLGIENIIRGKVVASFKFRSWWVLWVRVCSWWVYALKVLQLRINQFVIWFV